MPSFRKMAVLSVIEQARKELQDHDRNNLPGAVPSALSAGGQLAEGASGSPVSAEACLCLPCSLPVCCGTGVALCAAAVGRLLGFLWDTC